MIVKLVIVGNVVFNTSVSFHAGGHNRQQYFPHS